MSGFEGSWQQRSSCCDAAGRWFSRLCASGRRLQQHIAGDGRFVTPTRCVSLPLYNLVSLCSLSPPPSPPLPLFQGTPHSALCSSSTLFPFLFVQRHGSRASLGVRCVWGSSSSAVSDYALIGCPEPVDRLDWESLYIYIYIYFPSRLW